MWDYKDENGDTHTYWYHVETTTSAPLIGYVAGAGLLIGAIVVFFFSPAASLALLKASVTVFATTAAVDVMAQTISQLFSGGTLYEVYEVHNTAVSISIAYTLRNSVATYYRVLQEIALVALLCVLLYVAIRMILSVTARRKSKI